MKRINTLLLICSLLFLAACAETENINPEMTVAEEEITAESPSEVPAVIPEPTPEPTPEWKSGIAAGYGVGILYSTADRGSVVEITGEDAKYYFISFDGRELCVEKCFVRDAAAEKPKERTAFAGFGAEIYSDPYLTGEPLEKLAVNTSLTVIDEFGDIMLVKTDATEGYIEAASVSPVWIVWTENEDTEDKGQSSAGNIYTGGTDGGDITLGTKRTGIAAPVMLVSHYEKQSDGDEFPKRGVILADGTEIYLGIVYPGDELMVLSADEKTAEIYTDIGTGTLPRWAVLLADEEPHETWTGYASYMAKLFPSWHLAGVFEDIRINTEMTVILDTGSGYFVKLSDGRYGYMEKTTVSSTYTVINNENAEVPEPAAEEWTVPVL